MRRYTLQIGGREFVVDIDDLAADRYAVQVGEHTYEVTLASDEAIAGAPISPQIAPLGAASAGAPAAARPRPVTTGRAAPPVRATAAGGGDLLKAPMPGLILAVSVAAGAKVERGQDVAILEAMKMQNVIRAPRAGTVAEVLVAVGQTVGHGDSILRYEAQ